MARRRSKSDSLKYWRSSLENARQWREDEGYDALWVRLIDFYRNRQLPQTATAEDRITVNVFFSTINVIYPSISVNYPKITVSPNKPEDDDRAVITEAIVNYQWQHFNFQDEFRLAVKDFLMVGHGWLKVGWKFVEKEEALDEVGMAEVFEEQRAAADAYAAERPDLAADLPSDDEITANLPATSLVVVEDRPTVERVSFHDIYVDPEATTLENAGWIAQRIVRSLSDVRSDESYKSGVRRRVKPDAAVHTSAALQTREWRKRNARNPESDRVTVWEVWDLKRQTFCVFAQDADDFLVDPEPAPYKSGHPFVMLRNYDVPDYFYPMGDLEAIESLQLELNKTRSQMMQARKKFARKYLIRSRAFSSEGREALESDEDNRFVSVEDEQTPFDNLIAPLPQVPLPADLYNHSETVESDIGDVSGVSEYQRGQVPETRRTATEAAIISDSVNARAADKLALVEKCIARVARRVIQFNAQFVTQEQYARVVDQDGANIWVPYDETDVSGEYDFDVEGGSTQPRNETVRRQEATALAQAMQGFVEMGVVDPVKLVTHLLREGFGVRAPQKFINPMALQQMQMQEQQAEMQEQMMAAGMDPAMIQQMMAQGGMGGMGGMGAQGGQAPGGIGGPQGAPMGGGFMDASGMNPQELAAESI